MKKTSLFKAITFCVAASTALVLSAVPSLAIFYSFTKVADYSTYIPGSLVLFNVFSDPYISEGDVVFWGGGPDQRGIYATTDAALGIVADRSTAIPGGIGNFTNFSEPYISSGDVTFHGFGSGGQQGIYFSSAELLSVVASTNTAIPDGTGSFTYFGGAPAISNGDVAFLGAGNNQRGIYITTGGSLVMVADLKTAVPGGTGNFTGCTNPAISNGEVVFLGFGDGQQGIYSTVGGSLGVVANLNTAIPGGSGTFSGFGSDPSISNDDVSLLGFGDGQQGIYSTVGDSLDVVANLNTAIPEGSGKFTGFGLTSVSDGHVAFNGYGSGQDGIYALFDGTLEKVIDLNTTFNGQELQAVILSRKGLDGEQFACYIGFSNGDEAIYTAKRVISDTDDDKDVDGSDLFNFSMNFVEEDLPRFAEEFGIAI